MQTIKLTTKNKTQVISTAVKVIKSGGILIYPTETCYGVGVDATNDNTVKKLLEYKSNRGGKPISVAVSGMEMAEKYVKLTETSRNIYQNFLPGPFTVVSKSLGKVSKFVESSLGTVGVRIPQYPLVLDIVKAFKKPITSTSANASYKKTPYSVKDILDNLSGKQKNMIDLIIDAGTLPKNKPSTIVDATMEEPKILRKGDKKFEGFQVLELNSEDETYAFAKNILKEVKPYLGKKLIVFELVGELGTGKTHFSKYLGKELGIKKNIMSPTYVICNEFDLKLGSKKAKMFHMDTYRMIEGSEIEEFEPEKMFNSPNIVLIEWANKVSKNIKKYTKEAITVEIRFFHIGEHERKVEYKLTSS